MDEDRTGRSTMFVRKAVIFCTIWAVLIVFTAASLAGQEHFFPVALKTWSFTLCFQ